MLPEEIGLGWLVQRLREAVIVANVMTEEIVFWNKTAENLFGYSSEEAMGKDIKLIVPQEGLEVHKACMDFYRASLETGPMLSDLPVEMSVITKEGENLYVEMTLISIDPNIPADKGHYVLAMIRDVSERKRKDEERIQKEILDRMTDGFLVVDRNAKYTYVNERAAEIIGSSPKELIGHKVLDSSPELRNTEAYTRYMEAVLTGKPLDIEEYHVRSQRWLNIRIYPSEAGTTIFVSDVTNRYAEKEKLKRKAFYDATTGLPNKALFLDRLHHITQLSERSHTKYALFFMDLVGFKAVNDTYGHAMGDKILYEVGSRLNDLLRQGDTLARFGGDEFTLLVPNVTEPIAKSIAHRLSGAFLRPFLIDSKEISVSINIGLTIYPDHGSDADKLLARADQTMYTAKKSGEYVAVCTKPTSDKPPVLRIAVK